MDFLIAAAHTGLCVHKYAQNALGFDLACQVGGRALPLKSDDSKWRGASCWFPAVLLTDEIGDSARLLIFLSVQLVIRRPCATHVVRSTKMQG